VYQIFQTFTELRIFGRLTCNVSVRVVLESLPEEVGQAETATINDLKVGASYPKQKVMKKKISLLLAMVLGGIIAFYPAYPYAAGCTICETSTVECHRIIIGGSNEVHIFYGNAKECPKDQSIE
jgi:hypothetical protein